jgi:hypothetical protein
MCNITVLESQSITAIEQDRYLYINSATVTLVNFYRTGPVCVPQECYSLSG